MIRFIKGGGVLSKVVISYKQRNLLINSESSKQESFKHLYEYLQINKDIKRDVLEVNPQLNNIFTFIDDLLAESRLEWEMSKTKPYTDLGNHYLELKRECELCGKKNIKYENRIQNMSNNTVLVVGSECVKEFGDDIHIHMLEIQKNSKRAARRLFLEEQIPGIRDFVEFKGFINSYEIIIPKRLELRFKNIHTVIREAYNDFISDKKKDYTVISKKWIEKDRLILEIEKHVEKNKNIKFVATKVTLDWMLKNNKNHEIQLIRENEGFIKWRTIHRVFEPEFMKKTLQEMYPYLEKIDIEMQTLDQKQRIVILKFTRNRKFLLASTKYESLLLNYGGVLFEEKVDDFSFEKIFTGCEVTDSISRNKVLELVKKLNLDFQYLMTYNSDNQIIFKQEDQYILVKLIDLTSDLKKHYFSDTYDAIEINSAIEKNITKKMNEKEFENFKQVKEISAELKIK